MNRPEIIDAWLTDATQDLCDAARERITLEIRAHFNDAVAAHIAQEHSLLDAQLMALSDLGSSEEAAKRFRKKHLTKKDAKNLKNWMPDKFRPPLVAILPVVGYGTVALVHLPQDKYFDVSFLFLALSYLLQMLSPLASMQAQTPKAKLQITTTVNSLAILMVAAAAELMVNFAAYSGRKPVINIVYRPLTFYIVTGFIIWLAISEFLRWSRIWQKAKNDLFNWV